MNSSASTLLVVTNRGAEDPVCRLFLPYWRRSGCDLLFSSPLDDPSRLEAPGLLHTHHGKSLGSQASSYWHYQSRVLDTMKWCLAEAPHTAYVFTQYDSICLGPLPPITSADSIHLVAGGPHPSFQARLLLHPPWCFGHDRLVQFVAAADYYDIRSTEHGVMDRWLSLIVERDGQPFTPCTWGWSTNSIDTQALAASARAAITAGCLHVHGVKDQRQLTAILPPA